MPAFASAPSPSAALERAARRVQRARVRAAAVSAFARYGGIVLLVAGAGVLVYRTLSPAAPAPWWAPLAALALAAGFALWIAQRARPSEALAAAWLDVRGGASGAVVTEAELGSSAWSDRAQQRIENALAQLPRIDGLALARSLGLGALFAAAALFVPLPEASVVGTPPFAPERTLERLEEKLAALEDALALDPELSQELRERLERVEESAREERFDSTFEALDRLEERLDDSAARALEAAQRAQDDLAAAASDAHLDHAQEALESALEQLRESGLTKGVSEATQRELGAQLDSLPPGVQLSSQQLAALSRDLNQSLAKQLGKLGAARLIDPSKLRELLDAQQQGEGELDPDHECDENCKKPGGT